MSCAVRQVSAHGAKPRHRPDPNADPRRLIGEFLDEVGSEFADEAPSLPMEALGRQMNVLGGPSESPFPRNVGLLFFNEEPHRFFPAIQIDVVYFPEGAGGDRFEEKEFRGPLGRITRDAIEYIARALREGDGDKTSRPARS